jgi:hypothetical protein
VPHLRSALPSTDDMNSVQTAVAEMATAARAAGADDTDDVGRMVTAIGHVALALDAKMEEVQGQSVADVVERLVTRMLNRVQASLESRWRWRRWAIAVGCLVFALASSGAATGLVTYQIGRDLGAAESARWSAWCSDRKNIVVQGAEAFCRVPVQIPAPAR